MFGPLGWNIYSGFDASDFHISAAQLASYLGEEKEGEAAAVKDRATQVYMLKYLFANVNFSGKISREEDLRKLHAVIEDLISVDLASAPRALPDHNRGHYGIPRYDADFPEWVEKNLPKQDPAEIYGFNRNSERYVLKVKSFDIMTRMYFLNRPIVIERALGYQDLQYDLENQSIRISLAKSSLHTQSAQHAILAGLGDQLPNLYKDESVTGITDHFGSKEHIHTQLAKSQRSASQYFNAELAEDNVTESLLPLFVKIQKLLKHSSLDTEIKHDSDRFDERIDAAELPLRDEYDRKVSAVAIQMKNVLNNMLSERVVKMKLPFSHKKAVHNVFAVEIRQYIALIGALQRDVTNLMAHIDGKYMKPLEIEKLWSQIQGNVIPNSWRRYAFQTAFVSLADFVIELVERVKFWQHLLRVNCQVPAVWVPAFFDPLQYLNALKQKKSREENIPARLIKNTYEVMDFTDPTPENCPALPNTAYIHGMWLEGASWDRESRLMVEQTTSMIYDKFPVIRVTTELMTQAEQDALDGSLSDFEDNPPLSKQDLKEKAENDEKIKEQMDREDKLHAMQRNEGSKAKLAEGQKDRMNESRMGSAYGRMNSRVGSRQSGRSQQSRGDSSYNFKRPESQWGEDRDAEPGLQRQNSLMSHSSKASRVSK